MTRNRERRISSVMALAFAFVAAIELTRCAVAQSEKSTEQDSNIEYGSSFDWQARKGVVGMVMDGATVTRVMPNSPAAARRLCIGDRVVEVDGKPTDKMSKAEIIYAIRGPIGTIVSLTIERKGKRYSCKLLRSHVEPAVHNIELGPPTK